jgi:hypothetical protein
MAKRRIPFPTGIRIRLSCPQQIAGLIVLKGKMTIRGRLVSDLSMPLEDASCSILSKGVNCAATLAVMPTDDILCEVEKAIGVLPEETAEDVGQETIRILKGSYKPKYNLTQKRSPFRP